MAFDRTEAPGEIALGEAPQAHYSSEWGQTYVAPEEVRELLLLSEREARTLAAWAECLIPAQEPWPSAGEVNVTLYADNCAARSPLLRALLLRALGTVERLAQESCGRDFAECEENRREGLLRSLESGEERVLFDLVLELVYEGYYRDPGVLEVVQQRTGFLVNVPVEGIELEEFDETLLARVKELPGLLREVTS